MSTIRRLVTGHGPQRHRGAEECRPSVDLGVPVSRWYAAVSVVALCLVASTNGEAQTREFMLRGFGDVGLTTFSAEKSFAAVLGSDSGRVFGGGVFQENGPQ